MIKQPPVRPTFAIYSLRLDHFSNQSSAASVRGRIVWLAPLSCGQAVIGSDAFAARLPTLSILFQLSRESMLVGQQLFGVVISPFYVGLRCTGPIHNSAKLAPSPCVWRRRRIDCMRCSIDHTLCRHSSRRVSDIRRVRIWPKRSSWIFKHRSPFKHYSQRISRGNPPAHDAIAGYSRFPLLQNRQAALSAVDAS